MATATMDINTISIIDFLSRIGISPVEQDNKNYMYLSPFRNEKKASFSVSKNKNCWYDFGISGEVSYGLIGFIKKYYNVDDFIECKRILSEVMELPSQDIDCRYIERKSVLKLIREEPISNKSVIEYIKNRKVSLTTTRRYLKQCVYEFYGKERYGLSYKNVSGGTEIFGMDGLKCSLKSKSYSIFNNKSICDNVAIFEGIFDMLSYLKIVNKRASSRAMIILNSVTSIKDAIKVINPLSIVHCYLDRDKAGYECRDLLFRSFACVDNSEQYKGYKDLNDMLRDIKQEE